MRSLFLFSRAVATLAAARFMLRRRDTTTALRRLAVSGNAGEGVDARGALIAVRRAGRIVGGACLPQAVALAALLQRSGRDPVLVLGCYLGADRQWSAHAWVELDGVVLEPVIANQHATLACLTAANGWSPSPPDGR